MTAPLLVVESTTQGTGGVDVELGVHQGGCVGDGADLLRMEADDPFGSEPPGPGGASVRTSARAARGPGPSATTRPTGARSCVSDPRT